MGAVQSAPARQVTAGQNGVPSPVAVSTQYSTEAALPDLEARLESAFAGLAHELGRPPASLRSLLSISRARSLLRNTEARIGALAGKRVLEVGSGCGLVLALANRAAGADAWGIDPAQAGYDAVVEIARDVLRRFDVSPDRLVCAAGEGLPFGDGEFDAVVSYYAIEHVSSVQQTLREAARVLRPGGALYLLGPNYGSIWEGHYGVPWVPHLSKEQARRYVRLLGRSDRPLDDIHLVTAQCIERALRAIPSLHVESLGLAEFEARLRGADVADLDTARWAGPLLRLLGAPVVAGGLSALAGHLRIWTPLVVVARRAVAPGSYGVSQSASASGCGAAITAAA